MGKLSTCAKIFLAIHLVVTAFFVLLGCVILGVGIYLQVESRNFSFITGSDYATGPILLIISGLVTLIISAIGFIGGCLRWRPLLVIYAIIVSVIILLEIIVGIIGFVFRDTTADESEDQYRERLSEAIIQYDTDSDAEKAMRYLQDFLSCCGIDGPQDWALNGHFIWTSQGQLPESCQCTDEDDEFCGIASEFYYNYTDASNMMTLATYNSTNTVWTRGCFNRTVDLFIDSAVISAGIGLAIGIFEIIGVIITLSLVCCITCAKKNDEYV